MKNSSGILIISQRSGNILLLKRNGGKYHNHWSLVVGGADKGETPLETIEREMEEEIGVSSGVDIQHRGTQTSKSKLFNLFQGYVDNEFKPILNDEHTDWGWYSVDNLPTPVHPRLYKQIEHIFGSGK